MSKWSLLCVDAGCGAHCKHKYCVSTCWKLWHHTYEMLLCATRNKTHTSVETPEMSVGHRGCCHESMKVWANGCCTVFICFLIGSLLIYAANHWKNPAWLLSLIHHTRARTHTRTHTDICSCTRLHRQPAVTVGNTVCVSVSLSGLIINNAWLWEDERLFWLEACVSYGERDISASSFNYTSIHKVNAALCGCPQ